MRSPARLASESGVFWLIELVHDACGTEATLQLLGDRTVLKAVLAQPGSRLHPLADGGFRLHLEPLIDVAGPQVVPLLETLIAEDNSPDPQLRDAVRSALERGSRPAGSGAQEDSVTAHE